MTEDANGSAPGSSLTADAVQAVTGKVISVGVNGVGPFASATALADQYLGRHKDPERAIDRLIATQVRTTAATGFVSGLGGLITLPVTIPADLTSLWIMQARMVAAIAHLRGYDVESDETRSAILVTLLGAAGTEAMAQAGVQLGQKGLAAAIGKVSGKTLTKINQAVGFRLLTRAGTTGVINLTKFVPVGGGVVGGSVNGTSTRAIGKWAKKNFPAQA